MIYNNVLTFLVFELFLFGCFLYHVFRAIFFKFGQNSGFVKYQREKFSWKCDGCESKYRSALIVLAEIASATFLIFMLVLALALWEIEISRNDDAGSFAKDWLYGMFYIITRQT